MRFFQNFGVLKSLAVLLCFVFLSAKSPINHYFNEPNVWCTARVVNPLVDTNYLLVLTQPDTKDSITLKAFFQLPGSTAVNEITNKSLRFFVILPDGNFVYLGNDGSATATYTKRLKLQKFSGGTINPAHMDGWLLKKNDPNPPPPPAAARVEVGAHNNSTTPPPSINYMPVTALNFANTSSKHLNADSYLALGDAIQLGTSWSPFAHDSGYYYLIVSYTNKTSIGSISGNVVLDTCFEHTGYEIVDTMRFESTVGLREGPLTSGTSTLTFPIRIPFKNLNAGEIRHIYFKLKRKTTETVGANAQYSAALEYGEAALINNVNVNYSATCYNIVLKNNPHDPNKKVADQNACTANGNGTITYTIHFQNEGRGPAKDVIITDQLPVSFAPYNVIPLGASHPFYFTPSASGNITFTLPNIGLPGSNQTAPRVYSYPETEGWVKFTCAATCPPKGRAIENKAGIIFVGEDGTAQDTIFTENSTTTADTMARPQWNLSTTKPCDPCPPIKKCCIGWGRCKWCFYRPNKIAATKPKTGI